VVRNGTFAERSVLFNALKEMVRPERFELPTPCFVGKCSIQLSYGRTSENRTLGQGNAGKGYAPLNIQRYIPGSLVLHAGASLSMRL
jgi:hypothetical protein